MRRRVGVRLDSWARLVRLHMRGGVAVAVAVAGGDKVLNLISITCT